MDMIFRLIARIFEVSRLKEDEFEAICAIRLIIALLENIPGIESTLPNIIEYFIKELNLA